MNLFNLIKTAFGYSKTTTKSKFEIYNDERVFVQYITTRNYNSSGILLDEEHKKVYHLEY